MINFEKYTLPNGLQVIVHEDFSTPLVAVNVLYDVGARDESPDHTGFAHLFEHLMFGGSKNIPYFDEPLEMAGGENNAFTSNDVTNYYETVPAKNLEVALWLESDRMMNLTFSEQALDVQRKVVSEEFKEHYINQPYGDAWHKLRSLAYHAHPYQWPTIGKELAHVENSILQDVKDFFYKYYRASNAVLVIAGNVKKEEAISLAKKWFGDISSPEKLQRQLPVEPEQTAMRRLRVDADVPADIIYIAFKMPGRMQSGFYECDILSDILGSDKSSRLYQKLVKEKQLFSEIDAYLTASADPGLLVIEGKLKKGTTIEYGEQAIWNVIDDFLKNGIEEHELEKAKNKTEAQTIFSEMSCLNKAMNLAFAQWLGNANLVNEELSHYREVTSETLMNEAQKILLPAAASVLQYCSKN
jgi:zinc protease